jgi:hypothetical protein
MRELRNNKKVRPMDAYRHAYELLRPNGRIVAIMGEGVFFGSDKKAVEFREWLESVGGTSEKLPDNSFMDSSLPVNTGVNARMVIIDKQEPFVDAFTVSQAEQERIANDIDRLANSLQSYPQPVQMKMPPVLLALDGVNGLSVKDLPLELDRFTLRKMTGQVDGKRDASHQLTLEQVKQLPNELANPVAVLMSDDGRNLTVITTLQDPSGNPVISAIHLNKQKGKYVINELATTFGRERFNTWISKRYDKFLYINKNKSPANSTLPHFLGQSKTAHVGVVDSKASKQNILTPSDVVNKFETGGKFSQSSTIGDRTITQVRDKLISRFGKRIIDLLESKGILKIHQSMSDKDIPAEAVKQSEGVTEGFYLNGTVHLIADNLTDETIIPTFVHELGGHKGFQEMMSPKAYELIMQQFDRLVAQGNAIAIKAKQRAEKAEKDTARQQDEYIPYLLTEQEKAQFATPQERNAVKRLIDHILRAVKGWVVRTLSKYSATAGISKRVSETLDARDIQLMAERMIKDIAKRGGDNNNSPKFSKTEQSQFDRLLAKADKMIAEQGKLLAPNGKPSKLNRVQWAQVRTDNFKAWFGDWEKGLSSRVLNGEPVAKVSKSSVPDGGISQVSQWARDIFADWGNKVVSPILGKIDLSNNSVNDSIHHGKSKAKFAAFAAIKDVLEKGVVLDEATRHTGQITDFYVSAPVIIDTNEDIVTVLVKKNPSNQRMYVHSVTSKEKLLTTPYREEQVDSQEIRTHAKKSSEDIANILHDYLVFNPDSVSKVVDENGEPMVVYHGTRKEFNVFEPMKPRGAIGNPVGIYFDTDKRVAEEYAMDDDGEIDSKSKVVQAFVKVIDETDGLLKQRTERGVKHTEIIAFDPTQIKSAMGNNGEFNPADPDIRFSQKNNEQSLKPLNPVNTRNILDRLLGRFTPKADAMRNSPVLRVRVVKSFIDLPLAIQEEAKRQGSNGSDIKGVFHHNTFYAVADNLYSAQEVEQTFFHEVYGHYGVRQLFGDALNAELNNLWQAIGGIDGMRNLAKQHEIDLALYEKGLGQTNYSQETKNLILMDELLAHIAEIRTPSIKQVFNELMGKIRAWLRENGFVKLANFNNQDLAHILVKAKKAAHESVVLKNNEQAIRFSRAEDKAKAAKDYILDSVRIKKEVAANLNAKKELGLWHKTLGTQQNTAIQYKDFGRVYKTLQRLLQHQSSDVTDALEVAPTLLEKLDDLNDLKEQGKSIGRNISQYARKLRTGQITDREAVAKVIFGETLAKQALTQAELEQKLTKPQIKIYEEARAAVDVSLKNTAMSEIIRSLLQADAINFDTVEKHLNQKTGFDEFVDEMLENVGARISNAQAELSQATDKVQQEAIKEEIARLSDMYNSISNVNDKVYQLIDEAYAPLMRFGDYALTMRDKTTGKVLSFMMFETKAERNRMVNYLGTEYGNTVDLETDTMSTEDFKQFKGVTPETVALFAKEIGISKNEAVQAYLKFAIPATSALTRRIQRKGTAGFNEDIQRVLASFVMSNARYSAKNIYLAKADREISEIESGASVRDQAKKMRDNTIDPVDTFAWLRDLLFVWNLGGSVMFAFLNMTQPFLQTIPMLSQYVNTSFATKHVLRGIKVAGAAMATGNAPKGYEAEYKRAVHEGIVDPQNTFMLTGLERGGTGTTSKVWTGTKHILGLFAQMSESLNRKAVFIASLEVANAKGGAWLKQKGYASAYDFAVDVISQTQGVYNKANRSNWAHNPVGAPLLVFKQFSINYVEQMVRMAKNNNEGEEGKKAVLLMLFMLFSLAGGMGLPFIKDIFDLSETTAAFFGNPINIEREMRLMGKEYFGETTTGALMDGWLNKLVIGEVLGADIQSRTGMGDLIPMTNVLNPVLSDSQRVNEAASIFGAAGGLGEKVGDSIQFAANDEWGNALITILPRFATSMVRGIEMMTIGETTDSKGRKLFDVTIGEGLVKFADSQPVRMAELSRARGLEYDDIAIQRSKIEYYRKKWVKAAQKEDMDAIEQIEQDIQEWNENNEKYPVIFDRKRAYQTANKNDMTWGEREAKPPRGMEWTREERPDWMNEQ